MLPQMGNRASLSSMTPIRKEAVPQGGAPWRIWQHSAMLSLADQGDFHSPQANISTNNLLSIDNIFKLIKSILFRNRLWANLWA